MNKKTTWFLFFLVAGITLASCKKEDPIVTPPAPTKKELLSKKWKVDQVLVDSVDVTFFFGNARFDFRSNNTVILTLPFEDPDTTVWAFNAAETQIIIGPPGDQEVLDILALTSVQLKVRIQDPDEETLITMSPAP
jgi:hypothetical protein